MDNAHVEELELQYMGKKPKVLIVEAKDITNSGEKLQS